MNSFNDYLFMATDVLVGEGSTKVPLVECSSLVVPANCLVGISGPSGCGKSSLIRVLTGRQAALRGEIYLDGHAFSSRSTKEMELLRARSFGQVLQTEGLVDALTARENVRVGCAISGADVSNESIDIYARTLGLYGLLEHRPFELSGGQCQRVQLVRAMLSLAPLLALDEPTSGLDATWRDAVISAIAEHIHEARRGAIIVSHDKRVLSACQLVYTITQDAQVVQQR